MCVRPCVSASRVAVLQAVGAVRQWLEEHRADGGAAAIERVVFCVYLARGWGTAHNDQRGKGFAFWTCNHRQSVHSQYCVCKHVYSKRGPYVLVLHLLQVEG